MISESPGRATWIEVSESALRNNVARILKLASSRSHLMAVIKANAYGHGAAQIAPILLDAGASYLAVATLGEAIELRESGINTPLLVLGYTPNWLVQSAIEKSITLTLFDLATATDYNNIAIHNNQQLTIHLKVNSGMNRLGVTAEKALSLVQQIRSLTNLEIEGIFTHFATSDLEDKSFAYEQFARFEQMLTTLEENGLRPRLAHAANSAALLTMPETHLEVVRSGIALYGLHPDPAETPLPEGFQPALSWKAIVTQVARINPNESVSYGREFVASSPTTIAVLPVGYADGFPRRPYTYGSVLIHGCRAPIIGRVCMDQTIVDVTEIDLVQPVSQGDEVVLIGKQGSAEITADHVARALHTNNYDVVSRILSRVPRIITK